MGGFVQIKHSPLLTKKQKFKMLEGLKKVIKTWLNSNSK